KLAAKETHLPVNRFPPICPYAPEQILDEHFYPEADSSSR
ncbi:MAG: DUF29 family protein, partial [Pseudomonadota bacterium]|nr:DUF29 family protein [Pseudomonadota bacterium]